LIRDTGNWILLIISRFALKKRSEKSKIDFSLVVLAADAMVSSGLAALGYEHVNLGRLSDVGQL